MIKLGKAIPIETNRAWLSKDQKDEWGMLLLSIGYDGNDKKSLKDFLSVK